jgi:hypothetical protein
MLSDCHDATGCEIPEDLRRDIYDKTIAPIFDSSKKLHNIEIKT